MNKWTDERIKKGQMNGWISGFQRGAINVGNKRKETKQLQVVWQDLLMIDLMLMDE